jgi:membrane protein YqaA with SNARE-associated domain
MCLQISPRVERLRSTSLRAALPRILLLIYNKSGSVCTVDWVSAMLRKCYDWILNFATHPKSLWILVGVSFAESSFFPIPPDPLYIAMILAHQQKVWRLAFLCTLSSVIGGILGYYIGYALYETLGEWIINAYRLEAAFDKFQSGFNAWGFWIVALKGLTPIPYKVVTIFSGLAKLDLTVFILASIVARGFRFYTLALLLRHFGPSVKNFIEKNLALVTILLTIALVSGFLIIKYL